MSIQIKKLNLKDLSLGEGVGKLKINETENHYEYIISSLENNNSDDPRQEIDFTNLATLKDKNSYSNQAANLLNTTKPLKKFKRNYENNYFNSAIQILSHCDIFAYYFLNEMYINPENPKEIRFAEVFHKILKKVWGEDTDDISENNNEDKINIDELKLLYQSSVQKFGDSNEKTAEEVIENMLNFLSSELSLGRSRSNERSVITDLFGGELSVNFHCANCKKTQIKNDSFYIVNLKIPEIDANTVLKVKYFPCNSAQYQIIPIELKTIKTVEDFKNQKPNQYFDIIKFDFKNSFSVLGDSSDLRFESYSGEIVIYEKIKQENFVCFYIFPLLLMKRQVGCCSFSCFCGSRQKNIVKERILTYPICVCLHIQSSLDFLFFKTHGILKIFEWENYYEKESSFYENMKSMKLCVKFSEHDGTHDFVPINTIFPKEKSENLYSFFENGNSPDKSTILYYIYNEEVEKMKNKKFTPEKNNFDEYRVDLEKCFELFKSNDKLNKQNGIVCQKCNSLISKVENFILSAPIYLFMSIDRQFYDERSRKIYKNTNLIYYKEKICIDSLMYVDMGEEDKKKYTYELIGVCEQDSNENYISRCKIGNKWFRFADEDVILINNNFLTPDAILLLYQLKSTIV